MQTEILKTLWHGGVYVICPHDSTRKREWGEITVSVCLFLYIYISHSALCLPLPPADSDFNSLQQSTLSAARDSFGYFSTPPAAPRTTQLSSDPSRKIQKKNEIQFFAIIAKGKYKNPFEVTYVKRGRQRGAGQGRSQRGAAQRAGLDSGTRGCIFLKLLIFEQIFSYKYFQYIFTAVAIACISHCCSFSPFAPPSFRPTQVRLAANYSQHSFEVCLHFIKTTMPRHRHKCSAQRYQPDPFFPLPATIPADFPSRRSFFSADKIYTI